MITNLVNDTFLRACHKKDVEYTPVWFMRQAGRYLESYRKIRAEHSVLEICKTPELSSQVAVNAVKELGVDAAILFADIMLPIEGVGVELKIVDGGPVITSPVRDNNITEKLDSFDARNDVPYVLDGVHVTKSKLNDQIPIIGFSGAPFTLASYLIEGGPSRDFIETKKMMYQQPGLWNDLMSSLTDMVSKYLLAQIRAGVDAVQIFDSWVGCLSPVDYEQFVFPHTHRIFESLTNSNVPRILFGVGTAGLLGLMAETGTEVVSVDWRVNIGEVWKKFPEHGIQGNLDPGTLLGDWQLVQSRSKEILNEINGRLGHIFNLGHGVLPETNPAQLKRLVEFVHQSTKKRR
jgi:uroporphyrinogen decarboxylase